MHSSVKKPLIRPGFAWPGLLLGLLFMCGSFYLAHHGFRVWFLFHQVQGEVMGTAVEEKRSSRRGAGSATSTRVFRPVIAYRYSVDGRDFESNRFDFFRKSASRKWAEKVTNSFKGGDVVTVYYDPANPWTAVISRRFPLIWAIGLFCVGSAIIYGCSRVLRRRNE